MHATMDSRTLVAALKKCKHVMIKDLSLVYASALLTVGDGGHATLRATDLEVFFETPVEATGGGEFMVPITATLEALAAVGPCEVCISDGERPGTIFIDTPGMEFTLDVAPAGDFPEFPALEATPVVFEYDRLVEQFSKANKARALEKTRFVMNVVLLGHCGGARFEAVGCDGRRMHVCPLDNRSEYEGEWPKTLVPGALVNVMERLWKVPTRRGSSGGLMAAPKVVAVSAVAHGSEHQYVCFEHEGERIVGRCAAGSYPDYRSVIPAACAAPSLLDDRSALAKKVRALTKLVPADAPLIRVNHEGSRLRLSGLQKGRSFVLRVQGVKDAGGLPAPSDGFKGVGLNPAFLADALDAGGRSATWGKGSGPVRLDAEDGSVLVVMPVLLD